MFKYKYWYSIFKTFQAAFSLNKKVLDCLGILKIAKSSHQKHLDVFLDSKLDFSIHI